MTIQLDLYPADQEREEYRLVHPYHAIARKGDGSRESDTKLPHCTSCNRMILTVTTLSCVASEYRDDQGRCWDCNRKGKA